MQDTYIRRAGPDGAEVFADAGRHGTDHAGGFRPGLSGVGRFPFTGFPTWDDGNVPAATARTRLKGPLSGRGRGASGGGNSDGLPLREPRGRGDLERPCFDLDVPADGYAWWYVDGISDDGERAISIIGFIGSVFSPWYRWSRRKNPANHSLPERGNLRARRALDDDGPGAGRAGLSRDRLQIGPSAMVWAGRSPADRDRGGFDPPRAAHHGRGHRATQRADAGGNGPYARWRPCLAPLRAQGRYRGAAEPAGLVLDRAWLFRREFRDAGAGGRFQLLDLGAVSAERRCGLLLRRPAPGWDGAGRRHRLCRGWNAPRHRYAAEGKAQAPRLDGPARDTG